jgi:HD-GYP domain-containing protein (c-di-GMP phosphodiesterase class II)
MGITRRIVEPEFIAVEARELTPGSLITFDILEEPKVLARRLFPKGTTFTQEDRQLLMTSRIETVYVRFHEKSTLEQYLSRERASSRKSFYDDPLEFRNSALYKEQYYQVDRSTLRQGTEITFNLFLLKGIDVFPLLSASERAPVMLDKSSLNEGRDIVIRKADIPNYRAYLSSADMTSSADRAILTKESGKIAIKDLLENPSDPEKVEEVSAKVEDIVGQVFDSTDVLYTMLSLQDRNYYIYSHSINVAVLSLALGVAAGLTKDELIKLGIGAILHDIGMSVLSPEITNKQGKLSYSEYSILKMHVIEGEKILSENRSIPEESLLPVLQHHEKLSGRGYPLKLKGDKISLFGRITAIADCYDSLITRRAYRAAHKPFEALSIIARETGSYDPDLLKVFIRVLGKVQ